MVTDECNQEFQFPKKIYNRPGLEHIAYRIGRFSEFRKYLLKELNRSKELKAWTHHSSDDPAFAILEGSCILADILTFYQELYANEAYLRTAIEKESIKELVTLVGYRLSPGLAGSATFLMQVKGDKPVTIPPNLPIRAEIEGMDEPVVFETKDECICYPGLNKFCLYSPLFYPEIVSQITGDTREFYLDNLAIDPREPEIKSGDRLLIGDIDIMNPKRIINAETILVDNVRQVRGRTVFTIKGKLKRTSNSAYVTGFKIRRVYRHFGHNAPEKTTKVNSDGTVSEETTRFEDLIMNRKEFAFDPEVEEDMAIGTTILVQGFFSPIKPEVEDMATWPMVLSPDFSFSMNSSVDVVSSTPSHNRNRKRLTLIRHVTDIHPGYDTRGSFSGSTSLVTLNEDLTTIIVPLSYAKIDIRNIEFFEITGQHFILRSPGKILPNQKGSIFYFYGIDNETISKLKGRSLTLVTKDKELINATVLSSPLNGLPNSLQLDKELEYKDFSNEEPTTQAFGNLVAAEQGERQEEILEPGDDRQEFQTFKLSKSPLTYFNSSKETPPETPKLHVYVNNHLWKQVPSFFDRKSDDHIYVASYDEDGNSWIQFGDGKTGRRLPTGIGNILAKYKIGSGASGKLKPDTTVKPLDKTELIDEIYMYDRVSGGTKPEQAGKAKQAAPGKILSLGRMVSLKDYESEALSIAGVTKASTDLLIRNGIPTIVVVLIVEGDGQVISNDVQRVLIDYDKCRGMQRFPIEIIMGSFKFIYVEADYSISPTYRKEIVEQQIQDVLGVYRKEGKEEKEKEGEKIDKQANSSGGLFAAKQRRFGQAEYATSVEGAIQSVDGVIWAKVKSMYPLGSVDDPETIVIPNISALNPSVTCDDRTQVLRLSYKHLKLNDVSEKISRKEC